ncbi:hypothetical protein [Paenibacillus physcomitrellae]|uniref:Uncharacterized protein n=1 Tax=Paenibacillus physcomitrellae TaxID=1619311 RepID=A0ABQ1FRL7_9BACL|nr:hypothetical protein [Paenibacillus physcomitrellae]GGA28185.1 hypothetical protein GCM10010917_11430 [Paenibacillus physcomitrellae]
MKMIIKDYELEAWLRSTPLSESSQPDPLSFNYKLTWHQRVQYAAGHALNDYFSLQPHQRLSTPIQSMLNRRWPRSKEGFNSSLHYWEIYNCVVASLTRFCTVLFSQTPILMFEEMQVRVPELAADLSMIFPAIWQGSSKAGGVKLQKFMVEDQPELMQAFLHMANVFWNSAYGYPPDEIEIVVLLAGQTFVYPKDSLNLQKSLDYVLLLSETVEQDKVYQDCACNEEKDKIS